MTEYEYKEALEEMERQHAERMAEIDREHEKEMARIEALTKKESQIVDKMEIVLNKIGVNPDKDDELLAEYDRLTDEFCALLR